MDKLDKAISFKTEKFDYKSDLPEEYNAGNRFYGRDTAAYFCEQIKCAGIEADFLDEDWGWLILGEIASVGEFEIAVYNINDHSQGGRAGAPKWGLWIQSYQRKKFLGLFSRKIEVSVPSSLEGIILGAIEKLGAVAEEWSDDPER